MKETKYKCDLCTNEDPPEHMVGLRTTFLIDANRDPTYRFNSSAPRFMFTTDLKAAEFHLCHLCFAALRPALDQFQTRTGDCDQGMAQRPQAVAPVKQDDVLPQPEPKAKLIPCKCSHCNRHLEVNPAGDVFPCPSCGWVLKSPKPDSKFGDYVEVFSGPQERSWLPGQALSGR